MFPFASPETIKELVCPPVVSGMVTGTRRSAIGQFFSMSLVTVPEVSAKVNSFLKLRMAFIRGFMFPTCSPYSRPVLQIQVNSFRFLQVNYSVQVTYGRLPTLGLEDFRPYFALKFILYWIFSINSMCHLVPFFHQILDLKPFSLSFCKRACTLYHSLLENKKIFVKVLSIRAQLGLPANQNFLGKGK